MAANIDILDIIGIFFSVLIFGFFHHRFSLHPTMFKVDGLLHFGGRED